MTLTLSTFTDHPTLDLVQRVDLVGIQLEATTGTMVVLLREQDEPHRVLPLFVGGPEASAIALGATGTSTPRPLTHDVMAALVDQLGARLDRVEVTELEDTTFFADLVLTGPEGDRRVDARPSDAIALAVRTGADLYVSEAVLDEAGAVVEEAGDETGPAGPPLDPEAIDAAVEEFRDFLSDLDPEDFADAGPTTPTPGSDQ